MTAADDTVTSETFRPRSSADVEEVIRHCLAREVPVEVLGAGTKRALGRPSPASHCLDISGLRGVVKYEPEELVLTAKAGTPYREIAALLADKSQMLAFEPPDYGPLFSSPADAATLGGLVAVNASGPRRIKTGAARDHILGFSAVSGRGEAFKAGGKVVKNVTGYDLPKLLAGSFGTLAVMTEITFKIAPRPESEVTLIISELSDAAANRAMTLALQSAYDVSGAAHLSSERTTALRLEGFGPSVADRTQHLKARLGTLGAIALLEHEESQALWRRLRDVTSFIDNAELLVWRLSLPPANGAAAVRRIKEKIDDLKIIYDWGGALVWIGVPGLDPHTELIRPAAQQWQGHATLFRAPRPVRQANEIFAPLPPALKDLTLRVKDQFDPKRVLNPGRMYSWA